MTEARGILMGNSYSGTKPSLPTLNISKAKQLNQDTPDDLYVGTGHPQRNVVPLSARLPGSARKLPPTATAQQQQMISPQVQESAGAGMDHTAPHRIVANNIVAKPKVTSLNLGRHDGSFGASLGGGSDQSMTARATGHSGPGSLPHVQQHRVPHTSRAAYASQQYASTTDAVRSAPAAVETGPITPAQALKRYEEYLTAYEQSEVLQYTEVWFLGKADVQKIKGNPHLQKTNFGYDDERGDYQVVVSDHIAYRYEVQGVLGKGSFGQVLKVLDYKTGSYKALKIIRNKKRFHHQAQVELKVLQHLRHHDPDDQHHVIHIQEHFLFRNHLCITFELLSINLYEFIKQNNFQGLSLQLIRRFAQQMLVSLKFLRRHQLIHCDLKPENILLMVPQRSAIKVIDFGSSCFVDERMYTYVQSRFYRSPEVIMGLPYGCEIDMWSFGCILAELYMGYPLFPGEDEVEQLLCIMEIMGPPPRHLVETASRRKVFFDANGQPNVVPNSRGKMRHPGAKTLWGVLRCKEPGFVDLLERCLRWDPAERITPEQAMAHPWMAEVVGMQQNACRQGPAANRTRADQVPVSSSGMLQPSSVLAAASAALAAAAAGFTGSAGSSTQPTVKSQGAKAAAGSLVAGGAPAVRGSGTPGVLCSGEPAGCEEYKAAHAAPHAAAAAGVPISVAAGAAWHMQMDPNCLQQGNGSNSSSLHTTHVLQQHSSSGGGNDTSQSGIDCTPRSLPVATSGGSISATTPAILSGVLAAAHVAGHGSSAASSSVGVSTPRSMDTDAPGGLPTGVKAAVLGNATKHAATMLMAASTSAQQQQQQSPVLSARQRHSSGGLDVMATGGMRGQADQAALVAAGNLVKMQATAAVAAGAAPGPADAAGIVGIAPSISQFLAQQKKQQQQQQCYVVDAATWAEQVAAEQQHGQDSAGLSRNVSLSQQQALLMQQQMLLQQQQQLDMTVVGHAAGTGGTKPHEQFGTVFIDRLLPRLQH